VAERPGYTHEEGVPGPEVGMVKEDVTRALTALGWEEAEATALVELCLDPELQSTSGFPPRAASHLLPPCDLIWSYLTYKRLEKRASLEESHREVLGIMQQAKLRLRSSIGPPSPKGEPPPGSVAMRPRLVLHVVGTCGDFSMERGCIDMDVVPSLRSALLEHGK